MQTVKFGLVALILIGRPAYAEDAGTASFEPGTYGEPFVVEATVQGCGTGEEGDICFFYAEGARWAAARGQTSNEAALQLLADAPVNAPFLITGDMISFGDITAESAVAKLEPGQPDQWAVYRDGMQGAWVSTDDPASVLRIFGSEQTLEYDGQVMEVSVMRFGNACTDGVEIGPVFTTQMMGGDPMDAQCYAILDVSPDRIDLSYVGRGNTLSFTRAR